MKALQRSLRETFRPARRPDPHRKARELAKMTAVAHCIEIEPLPGSSGMNVWPPKGFPIEGDPFEGDHYAQDWPDALERVQAYVQALARALPDCLQVLEPRIRAFLNDSLCNDESSADEEIQAHWCAEFGLTAEQAAAALTYRARCLAEPLYRPFPETLDCL